MNPRSNESKEEYKIQLCKRVGFYLEQLFHGRTREMARYLGITHSVISKVSRGLQGPGEDFLNRLSGHPLVNTDWLLKGIGEPIPPTTSGTLPVSESILPGAPVNHRKLLTGERYPVSATQEYHSRYWLRHSYDLPSLWIMSGDLLLIETDSNQLSRLDLIHHKLCAVSVPKGDATIPLLASISVVDDKLRAKFPIGEGSLWQALVGSSTQNSSRISVAERRKKLRRRISPRRQKNENAADKNEHPHTGMDLSSTDLTERFISAEDIKGIALLLERTTVFRQ